MYYLVNLYYECNNVYNNLTGTIMIPVTQIQSSILNQMIRTNRIDKFSRLNILSYYSINIDTYNIHCELLNDKYYILNNILVPQYNIIIFLGNILNQK
jgi:hypothetical protein